MDTVKIILHPEIDLIIVNGETYELYEYADIVGITTDDLISSVPKENIEDIVGDMMANY